MQTDNKRLFFFAKLDIKDAYYSINVERESKKKFRFFYCNELYEFNALAQGYSDAPRIFTKIIKVPLAYLRSLGHINLGYLDDIYLQGETFDECSSNIDDTIKTLDNLGFTINHNKSILVPVRRMDFLGFILDSREMLVRPTEKKGKKIKDICTGVLKAESLSIRQLDELIGNLVALTPGNRYSPILYKRLEIFRNKCLKKAKGNYDSRITLSDEVRDDIKWWTINADKYPCKIKKQQFTSEMYTDASLSGYGIVYAKNKTNGLWNDNEKKLHINSLELLAVKYGLMCFFKETTNEHIHVFCDNSVTVSGINKMGSCKATLNNIIREIWVFCMDRDLMITCSHIPGKENIMADTLSRKHKVELEWKLNPKIYEELAHKFGPFMMDLFASRINFQIKPYASWNPDPEAAFINAFNMNWTDVYGYIFPPFSLIHNILQKIQEDKAEMLIIVPFWKTQSWFSILGRLLIDLPVLIPNRKGVLTHPLDQTRVHPLFKKLNLVACRLSGVHWKQKEFQRRQQKSSWHLGEKERGNNMKPIQSSLSNFVVKGIRIPVLRLQT